MGSDDTIVNWVQAGFAGILTLLTLFYVITTRRQLAAMEKALEETRRSNAATEKSNEIAERSLELGRRAWLVASDIETTPDFPPGLWRIKIENTGGVPALDVLVRSYSGIVRDWSEIKPKKEPANEQRLPIASKGHVFMKEWMAEVSSDDVQQAAKKGETLVVYVEIEYTDCFMKPRKTTNCWSYLTASKEWTLVPDLERLE